MIMMTKPYDDDDDTDDDKNHKNANYTAAGAAYGASVSDSGFWYHLIHVTSEQKVKHVFESINCI